MLTEYLDSDILHRDIYSTLLLCVSVFFLFCITLTGKRCNNRTNMPHYSYIMDFWWQPWPEPISFSVHFRQILIFLSWNALSAFTHTHIQMNKASPWLIIKESFNFFFYSIQIYRLVASFIVFGLSKCDMCLWLLVKLYAFSCTRSNGVLSDDFISYL